MTDDWYTADKAHLLVAKKGTVFRRADAKYTSADVFASDDYIEGRLFEPIPVATATGQSNTYLPKFRTTQYRVGRWQEILKLQTARNIYPAIGISVDVDASPNTHTMAIRTAQAPVNMGRHWERENVTTAEDEEIDMIGLSLNTLHIECSEAFPVAVQQADWNVNFTLNTDAATDDIASAELTDEPFKWNMFTFPINTYNSETLECDIVGWAFDIQNTVRITGLDSTGYYTKAKYIPLTMVTTTLEIIPYGRNVFELLRTPLESYVADPNNLNLTVKCARDANDFIQWTHDDCYCQPYTMSALKRPGSVERYFLVYAQLNTGSIVPLAHDNYSDDYYSNP